MKATKNNAVWVSNVIEQTGGSPDWVRYKVRVVEKPELINISPDSTKDFIITQDHLTENEQIIVYSSEDGYVTNRIGSVIERQYFVPCIYIQFSGMNNPNQGYNIQYQSSSDKLFLFGRDRRYGPILRLDRDLNIEQSVQGNIEAMSLSTNELLYTGVEEREKPGHSGQYERRAYYVIYDSTSFNVTQATSVGDWNDWFPSIGGVFNRAGNLCLMCSYRLGKVDDNWTYETTLFKPQSNAWRIDDTYYYTNIFGPFVPCRGSDDIVLYIKPKWINLLGNLTNQDCIYKFEGSTLAYQASWELPNTVHDISVNYNNYVYCVCSNKHITLHLPDLTMIRRIQLQNVQDIRSIDFDSEMNCYIATDNAIIKTNRYLGLIKAIGISSSNFDQIDDICICEDDLFVVMTQNSGTDTCILKLDTDLNVRHGTYNLFGFDIVVSDFSYESTVYNVYGSNFYSIFESSSISYQSVSAPALSVADYISQYNNLIEYVGSLDRFNLTTKPERVWREPVKVYSIFETNADRCLYDNEDISSKLQNVTSYSFEFVDERVDLLVEGDPLIVNGNQVTVSSVTYDTQTHRYTVTVPDQGSGITSVIIPSRANQLTTVETRLPQTGDFIDTSYSAIDKQGRALQIKIIGNMNDEVASLRVDLWTEE